MEDCLAVISWQLAQEMFRSEAVVGEISWPIPTEPSQVGRFEAGR